MIRSKNLSLFIVSFLLVSCSDQQNPDNQKEESVPLIYTTKEGAENLFENFENQAEIVVFDSDQVDMTHVLEDLHKRGASVVLGEGGPSLNHQLTEAQLVDELCLTISPILIGGTDNGIASGPVLSNPNKFQLAGLATQDGFLFCNYLAE